MNCAMLWKSFQSEMYMMHFKMYLFIVGTGQNLHVIQIYHFLCVEPTVNMY